MRLVYVIGPPGVGKTATLDTLVAPYRPSEVAVPFRYRIYPEPGWTVLGPARAAFGGTDALSMSVQPKVVGWLAGSSPPVVLGEGDRLANLGFLRAATDVGYETFLVVLSAPETVVEERRTRRAAEHDSGTQNASWVAGRRTKVARLAAAWSPTVEIDASRPVAEVAADLAAVVNGT